MKTGQLTNVDLNCMTSVIVEEKTLHLERTFKKK